MTILLRVPCIKASGRSEELLFYGLILPESRTFDWDCDYTGIDEYYQWAEGVTHLWEIGVHTAPFRIITILPTNHTEDSPGLRRSISVSSLNVLLIPCSSKRIMDIWLHCWNHWRRRSCFWYCVPLISITSPSSMIYQHERQCGRPPCQTFWMYKFRSMENSCKEAEGEESMDSKKQSQELQQSADLCERTSMMNFPAF